MKQTYKSAAGLSDCGTYRYWLTRTWDDDKPVLCWVMLNPSTADAEQDDPTIRKCIGFARRWGYGGICVVNLFALRATDPKQLPKHYPIDRALVESNNLAISTAARGRMVVAAWGAKGCWWGRDREVLALLRGQAVHCLKVTKDGHPWHPLYVADDTKLMVLQDGAMPDVLPAAPSPAGGLFAAAVSGGVAVGAGEGVNGG
jgi:hypothetical protein